MAKRDYYDVLGVSKESSQENVKKAYRRIAIENHPDRNPGDKKAEDRFKEATEAYEVLADEKKRGIYDRYGFSGLEGLGGTGEGGSQSYTHVFRDFGDIFGNFSGIFDSIFGEDRRQSGRGADIPYTLDIAFDEAVQGAKREITYRRRTVCARCNGAGNEAGSKRRQCPTCDGRGQIRQSVGFFSMASECHTCGGEGWVLDNPCRKCKGSGIIEDRRHIRVAIPAGIETGQRITIRGGGNAGARGGAYGDLVVLVRVAAHRYFARNGLDVYCVIPVSITQAALGAEIRVPTLDNQRVKINIPPGAQHDQVLRLRDRGISALNNTSRRGSLYVRLYIVVPRKFSARATTLLRELGAELRDNDSDPEPIPLSDL